MRSSPWRRMRDGSAGVSHRGRSVRTPGSVADALFLLIGPQLLQALIAAAAVTIRGIALGILDVEILVVLFGSRERHRIRNLCDDRLAESLRCVQRVLR